MKETITQNFQETRKLGENLAKEILKDQKRSDRSRPKQPKAVGPLAVCLSGDLGSGKTTFAQGLLEGLGADGPYTSPTFLIMKEYKTGLNNIYHLDCYRVKSKDVLDLGWEEIIAGKNNVVIIEWAERIRDIIPKDSLWIDFEWAGPPRVDERSPRVEAGENKRKIIFEN